MKLETNAKTGRVYARLKTGDPAKPYVRMTLGTKSTAEAAKKAKALKLPQLEAALQLGPLSQRTIARLTVGRKVSTEQAAAQWLAAAANRGESPATTAKGRAVLDAWFRHTPAVKSLAPMSVTEAHVSGFVNRADADVGYATRLRQLTVLRVFFRYCADAGLCQGNVAALTGIRHRELSHEQREPKEVLPFTAAEVKRLLANTEGWWRWATGISYATALRLGDIATLEHASLGMPGHLIVHTDKRDRRVCLPIKESFTPGLAALLSEIPPGESPYVFPEQAEQYANITSGRPKFSVQFARLLASLNMEGRSFHSLRHTAITRWDQQGFSLDQCKDYAGHTSTKTTAGYIHS